MTAKCPEKAAAKAAGLKRYVSSKPCPKGHGFERLTASGNCTECNRALRRAGYYRSPTQKVNAREAMRKLREADPIEARVKQSRARLVKLYGIDQAQYEGVFAAQNGLCPICEGPLVSRFDKDQVWWWSPSGTPYGEVARVDHCHSTGAVRGLLCSNCNIGLGKFRDQPRFLLNAVGYLRASATPRAQPMADRKTASEIEPVYQSRDLDSSMSRVSRRASLSPFI